MTEALVSELIAIIRRSTGDPGRLLAARLEREAGASVAWVGGGSVAWVGGAPVASVGGAPAPPTLLADLQEVARRARVFGATDEELALSIGALLATSSAPSGTP